ncbi:hypothetical protein BC629DRAFT_1598899 [Irpex lacteus]|nr:hypothetical protein BC629DRAFT_1598899 [Irpex lacteus]
MSASSDDFEPSQLPSSPPHYKTDARERRATPTRVATRNRIQQFYAPGGALDSQTTDSQFVEFLTYPKASVEVCHGPSHTSVGVQVSSGTLDISETARRMKVLQAQLDIANGVICRLEDELNETRAQRDRLGDSSQQATQELRQLRRELHNLATMHTSSRVTAPSRSEVNSANITPKRSKKRPAASSNCDQPDPKTDNVVARTPKRRKMRIDADLWIDPDEQSQLVVSPPRDIKPEV